MKEAFASWKGKVVGWPCKLATSAATSGMSFPSISKRCQLIGQEWESNGTYAVYLVLLIS
jgi:hypothetical protein